MNTLTTRSLALLGGIAISLAIGCSSAQKATKAPETGFLSDYSKLKQVDGRTWRYIAPESTLRGYQSFLVEPVSIRGDAAMKLSEAEEQRVSTLLRDAISQQLGAGFYRESGYEAAGTARVRSAITEFDPGNKGVAIEAEVVDSTNGKQVFAAVSSRLSGADADRVLQRYAERFRLLLDEANGTAPLPAGDLPEPLGFLSTYSNLEPRGDASLRYVDPNNRLARYEKFIILPVESYFYEQGTEVSESNTARLEKYMRKAIIDALGNEYQVVDTPGFDVAEVRVALSNIKRSAPVLNVLPRAKVSEVGLGGMSMEAEVIDSLSGVQIAALVESATGRNLNVDFSQFDDAKGAMDDWARRFRRALDDARERAR